MNTSTTLTAAEIRERFPALARNIERANQPLEEVFALTFGSPDNWPERNDQEHRTEEPFLADHGDPRFEHIRTVREDDRLRAARLARPRWHVRDVFQDEARNFTPWIAGNLWMVERAATGIDELGGLSLVETEHTVGRSRIDVLARVERSGKRRRHVVIENQLTPSDASHLGRLVKYAQLVDAYAAIWICPSFTSEDLDAIDALHRHMPARFAAVRCVATQAEGPDTAYVDFLPAREDRPHRDIDDFPYDYPG